MSLPPGRPAWMSNKERTYTVGITSAVQSTARQIESVTRAIATPTAEAAKAMEACHVAFTIKAGTVPWRVIQVRMLYAALQARALPLPDRDVNNDGVLTVVWQDRVRGQPVVYAAMNFIESQSQLPHEVWFDHHLPPVRPSIRLAPAGWLGDALGLLVPLFHGGV